jgi:hypothetical protein
VSVGVGVGVWVGVFVGVGVSVGVAVGVTVGVAVGATNASTLSHAVEPRRRMPMTSIRVRVVESVARGRVVISFWVASCRLLKLAGLD